MEAGSRTQKSLRNSVVAMAMFLINLAITFYSRKIFLDILGAEILGLNTTAVNLLQFLNLAELGIGSAIAFTLYKPLFDHDTESINEILAIQKWLYRRIAFFIIGGAVIIACFFPMIFHKMKLPLWYAYASFGVLLFGAVISYLVNYREVLLAADQKDYKIQLSYRLIMMLKLIAQIVALKLFSDGYVWWLSLEALFSALGAVAVNYTVSKTYDFLDAPKSDIRSLRTKYSDITKKIKQLFFHKIGSFVLTQTSPVIIYAYTTLTLVALYGNYMLVINGFTNLIVAVFNSMAAGVGNLIASGDRQHMARVFDELFSLRFVMIFSLCIVIYYVTPEFISMWIGGKYLLSNVTLLLMLGIFYIMTSRLTVDAFINGFGLYGDIWSPIVEGALNIGLSVLLGSFFGLDGIIAGVLISLVVSMLLWKPYYLFSRCLKGYYGAYWRNYLLHIAAGAVVALVSVWWMSICPFSVVPNMVMLFLYAITFWIVTMLLLGGVVYLMGGGIRMFVKRMLGSWVRK